MKVELMRNNYSLLCLIAFTPLFACAVLSGCSVRQPIPMLSTIQPPEDILFLADFGRAPTLEEGAKKIREYVAKRLKDPDSLRLTNVVAPVKAWARGSNVKEDGEYLFGWIMFAHVNAKNSFGGYTGAKLYKFIFLGAKSSITGLHEPALAAHQTSDSLIWDKYWLPLTLR